MSPSRLIPLSLVCIGLAISTFTARAQEVLDGIAAVVNSDVVTFSQVRELVGPKEKQAHETLKGQELVEKIKEIRTEAINDLIDRALIIQEFKTKGYTIPDYFIDDRIQGIIKDEFGNDRQAFLRTLAAQNYTLEKFRDLQKDMIIVSEMRKQAVKGATSVPDAKITAYYKEHLEEYSQPEQMKLRMIAIRGVENDSRRKMIDEIRQKIVGGAEFGDLARMYSEDSSQEQYGDWGWIDRKKLNESLTKTAFSLKPGEMSQVVELGGSYYLLYCEAKKPATVKPLKDVHDEIEKVLLQTERQQQQADWLAKLRRKAYIKMY
ncbi:PpiC-type peptidyl-prolyl cis-trans isomerase [Chthoniobacter flavus Ellin428]|uniref:peptidylprolyl isomerase n=1 Tax=Chthoniobacter flavus Ellin428 TaxID=497964 RepID=B4D0B1_9BACT|nr:peptidyl-prolyl cis-trans isomerase [Chthoniobacter flavus]EDY20425.1 PpiC-type peptidyl-prolyl cis-trans isomerase [Chthoniobacter flavus Ellin428]TCO83194.1 peptidyl-prolyl cis-trans isomerase SurA [Chthoniobacter flavus]